VKPGIDRGDKGREKSQKLPNIELADDAWERFERAVDVVIKSGPKHRLSALAKPKEGPASKGRVHKGKPRA